jgi:hypothetical protein
MMAHEPISTHREALTRRGESPRVYRRLHFLRGWSDEQDNEILPGDPGNGRFRWYSSIRRNMTRSGRR